MPLNPQNKVYKHLKNLCYFKRFFKCQIICKPGFVHAVLVALANHLSSLNVTTKIKRIIDALGGKPSQLSWKKYISLQQTGFTIFIRHRMKM